MDSSDLEKSINRVQILRKVMKVESERPYKERCLAANICPDCGGGIGDTGSSHPFISEYKCIECDVLHTI